MIVDGSNDGGNDGGGDGDGSGSVMIVVITSGGPDKYINIWQVGRGMFVANLHMWQGISHLRNRWEMEAFGET